VRAALTLTERELTRFFRQPNRIAGAIGQPLIFWLLFGAAFKASFEMPTYAFFLPGFATLTVLFTAIFSTMSIIEDRHEGFLQGVLVAPVARGWMVLRTITLPLLAPVMLVAVVFRAIDAFRVFDTIYVLTGGGPADSTETLSIYVYRTLFHALEFGYGSALAVVTLACAAAMTMAYVWLLTRRAR